MVYSDYFNKVQHVLARISDEQGDQLKQAGKKLAHAVAEGGIIQLFGAGHSHLIGEEVFYRAGGLVPVKPVLEEDLMLHKGAVRSSELERSNEYAEELVKQLDIGSDDVMIVSSTSGRNPVPIETAKFAKRKGAYVIALTSMAYSRSQASRHYSGERLYEAADLTIDNLSEKGDAALSHHAVKVPFAPTSTVVGTCIINAMMAEAVTELAESGIEPPVLLSGNLDGADEHNKALIDKYKSRIPML